MIREEGDEGGCVSARWLGRTLRNRETAEEISATREQDVRVRTEMEERGGK